MLGPEEKVGDVSEGGVRKSSECRMLRAILYLLLSLNIWRGYRRGSFSSIEIAQSTDELLEVLK
jgi:hypothetical protein